MAPQPASPDRSLNCPASQAGAFMRELANHLVLIERIDARYPMLDLSVPLKIRTPDRYTVTFSDAR